MQVREIKKFVGQDEAPANAMEPGVGPPVNCRGATRIGFFCLSLIDSISYLLLATPLARQLVPPLVQRRRRLLILLRAIDSYGRMSPSRDTSARISTSLLSLKSSYLS